MVVQPMLGNMGSFTILAISRDQPERRCELLGVLPTASWPVLWHVGLGQAALRMMATISHGVLAGQPC
jgi:hypothetical protein